ncbi:MAG TPA: hypothetical protein DCW33_01980, partial [Proteobacteria bacterium]|nr:hypothetical protein [Pseudomonadota bacterium]
QAKPSGYSVIPNGYTNGSFFDKERPDQDGAQAQSQATLVAPSQSSAFTGTAAVSRASKTELPSN